MFYANIFAQEPPEEIPPQILPDIPATPEPPGISPEQIPERPHVPPEEIPANVPPEIQPQSPSEV